jgi:hypothetical protein
MTQHSTSRLEANSVRPTKSDIDRRKQRAGSRKIALSKIRAALAAYRQGMSATAFAEEVEKAMRTVK